MGEIRLKKIKGRRRTKNLRSKFARESPSCYDAIPLDGQHQCGRYDRPRAELKLQPPDPSEAGLRERRERGRMTLAEWKRNSHTSKQTGCAIRATVGTQQTYQKHINVAHAANDNSRGNWLPRLLH
jgi:hypothetical protein